MKIKHVLKTELYKYNQEMPPVGGSVEVMSLLPGAKEFIDKYAPYSSGLASIFVFDDEQSSKHC